MCRELEYEGKVELLGVAGVLRVSGEIDLSNSSQFQRDLDDTIAAAAGDVMVDLSALEFMDSTALCAMLRARNRLSARRRTLILVAAPGRTRRLFEITGLETAFALEDTLQDAVCRATGSSQVAARVLAS